MKKRIMSMLVVFAMLVAILPQVVFATTDEVKTVADGIASKYASAGIAADGNAPWFAADMAAYLKTYPETEHKLTDAQKQDMADVAIVGIVNSTRASDTAKYIISLVAMGFDPTQITTSTGTQLNAVTDKLIAQSFAEGEVTADAKNEYTLPYVLIAFQQFGEVYSTEIDKLVSAAVETAETWNKVTYWYEGDPGSVDAVTPMMLALSPYYETESVKTVLDNAVSIVNGFQSANGSLGDNAASTGLGAVAFAALGIEPDSVVQSDSESSLIDYLLTQATTEKDGFNEPWGGSFNTEQGFRGLIAALNAESEVPYYLYDFSGQSLVPIDLSTVVDEVDETKTIADGIASKYATEGVATDGNAPWFAADMAAYLKTYPETEYKLTDEQKQDMADVAIAGIVNSTRASDTAKYIISLVSMGFDPTQITTSTGTQLNAVTDKMIAQSFAEGEVTADAKNEYTLPYVLIAFQQFGGVYSTEIDKLVSAAVETAETWNKVTYWYDGDPGSVDAVTPMMLALAPYYETESVNPVLVNAVSVVEGFQSANGSLGDNAASTGLGAVALAAMGIEPDSVVQTESESSLIDYLLTQTNTDKNGFNEPWGGSFNTEQGFRGLIAALNAESEVPYYLYDFSGETLQPVTERPGITFDVIPGDATVVVKNSSDEEQTQVSANCYNLEVGEYTYTVSRDGYVSKSGSISVVDGAQKQIIAVSLTSVPTGGNSGISVRVRVLTHDDSECGGKYTYKSNSDKYTEVLADERITLASGQTVFDALSAALEINNISYDESSYGYIGKIGSDEEFGHGSDKSGWQYRVNGVMAKIGCRSYKLTSDATVVWFFTDDYTQEYGSEIFTGGSDRDRGNQNSVAQKIEEKTEEKAEDTEIVEENNAEQKPTFTEETFVDVDRNDWHYESVKYVYENNLMQGTDSGFEPDEKMTRAMLVTVLFRLESLAEVNDENKFADVADGEWYFDAVRWAAANGVVSGVSETSFAPDEHISREQMAVIIYRYAKLKGYEADETSDLEQFSDSDRISEWALDAIRWANALQLIQGTSESSISPSDSATRAEVATILMRFCENIIK